MPSINSSGMGGYKGGGSSGGSSYSPNAAVINTGGSGGSSRLQQDTKDILDAISDIQQFYVIEEMGQEIPGEFLTLKGSLSYFKIGAKSGMIEGVMLALLLPVVDFYLLPFILKSPGLFLKIMFGFIPYMPVVNDRPNRATL
ncbi:MAG: hypothetical protein KJ617_13410 [Proteobacteria bacterium]|nr:hypothetical protein [Pseudomonadota bacterium]